MVRTLVSFASRLGGTEGIARAIADELQRQGLQVDLRSAQAVGSLADYDSVIHGSAVYTGRWMRPARRLLKRLVAEQGSRPVRDWLFHSGPTGPGAEGRTMSHPGKVAELAAALGTPPPQTFGGRIEPETAKGFLASSMAKGDLGGDYRNFEQVTAWAAE